MQLVLTKELVMDNSHSFSLTDLPISAGEKITVIVMRDNKVETPKVKRKVYAHRFIVDNVELPARDDLYER